MGFMDRVGAAIQRMARVRDAGLIVPWSMPGEVAVAADVLVIPTTHGVVKKTTGADAEALTLANGLPMQELTVILIADGGGTGTLTPATSTGWATAVFADVKDTLTFRYIDDTTGWIVVGGTGVAAPPVIS